MGLITTTQLPAPTHEKQHSRCKKNNQMLKNTDVINKIKNRLTPVKLEREKQDKK